MATRKISPSISHSQPRPKEAKLPPQVFNRFGPDAEAERLSGMEKPRATKTARAKTKIRKQHDHKDRKRTLPTTITTNEK